MPASGYTAISFTAGEQPTTAKWNLIGSNDASFNTGNGLNDGSIITRHIGAAQVTSDKLASHVKVGTGLVFAATGNLSVTGIGFKPSSVEFWFEPGISSGPAYYGYGIMGVGAQFTHSSYAGGTTGRYDSSTECASACNNVGVYISAKPVSFDADGFTINVTRTGGSFSWIARG